MSGTLDLVRQTCKTILFEEFSDKSDDEAPSLFSFMEQALAAGGTFPGDHLLRKIDTDLTVHSFEEFARSFSPKVYEYITDSNGLPHFAYTTDKSESDKHNGRLISIVGHPFFEMLESMYSQKSDKGLSNMDFPEDKIKAILTPQKQMESVYDMRRKLRGLAIDYEKAVEANQNARPFAEGIYNCRVEISEKFEDSPMALLALAITETDKKIANTRANIQYLEGADDGVAPALTCGRMGFDESGSLVVKEIAIDAGKNVTADTGTLALEERAVGKVLALVESDVRESGPEDDFSRSLVIAAYAPPQVIPEKQAMDLPALHEELANLENHREQYQKVYTQAQDAFIQTLTDVARKMLDVMVFFNHATVQGKKDDEFPAGLIVANCKASKFLGNEDTKKRFAQLMSHLGHERKDRKVWLGILPDVKSSGSAATTAGLTIDQMMGGPIRKDNHKNINRTANDNTVDLGDARVILDIMNESGILTVFNFTPEEKNTFAGITDAFVEKTEEQLSTWNNPHAVFAYPNFTVMREGTLQMGEDQEKIKIPAVYVSASYVAAGMIAASQQAKILEAKSQGTRLLDGEVCTRVDLEDAELLKAMPTRFNRELAYKWPAEIIPAITKNRFGFAFCGDHKVDPVTKKECINTYLLQARTLARSGSKYRPVYHTLTEDFINTYLANIYGDDMSPEDIERFINEDVQKWRIDAGREKNAQKINLVLRKGEDLEVQNENGEVVLVLTLKGGKVAIKPKIQSRTAEEDE